MKLNDKSEWHRWFAWHPVRIEGFGSQGRTRWLEFVERKFSYGIGLKYPRYREVRADEAAS